MLHSIEDAIADIALGKMVIVVDDEDRENEGDFIMAAEKITPEAVNFMAVHGRGIICVPLTNERAEKLSLSYMVPESKAPHHTPFTVTVDLVEGTTTGISADDRSKTIKALTEDRRPQDFQRPGHIFPLIARAGGVLERDGHTEAAVDLAKLAGLSPVGVICEIMNPDGTMARMDNLFEISKKFDLKIISIQDLINYRKKHEFQLDQVESVPFPTDFGNFQLTLYRTQDNEEHLSLSMGDIQGDEPLLLRVHSECLTGDVFSSKRCDCGSQLQQSLKRISKEGRGMVIYLRQEGRGIGLANKIRSYSLQDQGMDTIDANFHLGFGADQRTYDVAYHILKKNKVERVKLMTNNPEKVWALNTQDLTVVQRIPLEVMANETNRNYLETKRDRMGHYIMGKGVK